MWLCQQKKEGIPYSIFRNVALGQRFDYKNIKQKLHFEYNFY